MGIETFSSLPTDLPYLVSTKLAFLSFHRRNNIIGLNLLLVLVLVMRLGLIEDVDNAGLDAIMVAGAGGGSQKKAESVVSAGERKQ